MRSIISLFQTADLFATCCAAAALNPVHPARAALSPSPGFSPGIPDWNSRARLKQWNEVRAWKPGTRALVAHWRWRAGESGGAEKSVGRTLFRRYFSPFGGEPFPPDCVSAAAVPEASSLLYAFLRIRLRWLNSVVHRQRGSGHGCYNWRGRGPRMFGPRAQDKDERAKQYGRPGARAIKEIRLFCLGGA